MGEFVLTLLIFIGVTAVTAALFGGWLVVTVARFMGQAFGTVLGVRRDDTGKSGRLCPYERCRQPNLPEAKFCRRCGRPMATAFAADHPEAENATVV